MRRIDADALMKSMYHRAFETDGDTMWQSGCWVRYRAIEQTVKEQPTVEPKKGKWTRPFPTRPKTYERFCSECKGKAWYCGTGDYNFCPNCGADMRGEAE